MNPPPSAVGGQNPQRGLQGQKTIADRPQKRASWVNSSHVSTGRHRENGDFRIKPPSSGVEGNRGGVFRPRDPLLPFFKF